MGRHDLYAKLIKHILTVAQIGRQSTVTEPVREGSGVACRHSPYGDVGLALQFTEPHGTTIHRQFKEQLAVFHKEARSPLQLF